MPVQNADKAKQPGETLRYSMTFTPGKALAVGDSLTGAPSVTIKDSAGVDKSTDMIVAGSVQRVGNVIYVGIEGGTDGQIYKITFKCDTANGEKAVEEDLIIKVADS